MYSVDLCHLGEHCMPSVIIDDILGIKKKTLFMFGRYRLKDINIYLQDNTLEDIYNKEFFSIIPDYKGNNIVKHTKYNFEFQHDYKLNKLNEITNYELVASRFDIKIANFREMMQNPSLTIFIQYTYIINLSELQLFIDYLTQHGKGFFIIMFTSCKNEKIDIPNVSVIDVEDKGWYYGVDKVIKQSIAEEHYSKFIECLTANNIVHDFPKLISDTKYKA